MTTRPAVTRAVPRLEPATLAAAGLLAGLFSIVFVRAGMTRAGLDPLTIGAGFGVALGALWAVGAGVAARPRFAGPIRRFDRAGRAVVAGLAVGAALVGVALAGSWLAGLQLVPGSARPAAPFPAWAAVTMLVAATEEGILRGVLFDRLRAADGTVVALGVTTFAFALLHVPLYGWEIVPLDLAVGLALGGLRLSAGTVLAPVIAHAVADLATWWL